MISINIIEKLNLYDGSYYIDMGPGWIIGNDKDSILCTLIIPPGCTGTFDDQIKFESSIKVMVSTSINFNSEKFSTSFSIAAGHEWIKELTYSHSLTYTTDDNNFKYVQIYLIRHRYDILTLRNGIIQDWAIGYGGGNSTSGIWGDYIDFSPHSLVDITPLEQPIDRSFITNGNPQSIELYKSSLSIISKIEIIYSPNISLTKKLDITNNNSDVCIEVSNVDERAYVFNLSDIKACENIVIYKQISSEMVEYISSVDDNTFTSDLVIDMEEDTTYYFRFINCKKGSLELKFNDFNPNSLNINNSNINLYDKALYYINNVSLQESKILSQSHLHIGKIIYYYINAINGYDKLTFKVENAKFKLKIYENNNQTYTYTINPGTFETSLFAGLKFMISVECLDILDLNTSIEFKLE